MTDIEKNIIKLMEILFEIDENKKNEVIKSFLNMSEENKKHTYSSLCKAHQKIEENSKNLLTKMKLINNDVEEYEDKVDLDTILNQIN